MSARLRVGFGLGKDDITMKGQTEVAVAYVAPAVERRENVAGLLTPQTGSYWPPTG